MNKFADFLSEDITFCLNKECTNTKCMRHEKNIRIPSIPHSFADLTGTEYCENNRPDWIWTDTLVFHLSDGSHIYQPRFRCRHCGLITESYIRYDEPEDGDSDFPRFCQNCGHKMYRGVKENDQDKE